MKIDVSDKLIGLSTTLVIAMAMLKAIAYPMMSLSLVFAPWWVPVVVIFLADALKSENNE